ncbi:alcohol dehydrogenase catalytic domain-containing protein, partial [Rhabdaerophilum sp.]|uniref:alcohol dehydrogenase catalytic domain-containing protein n=1 Tax=Rhabdaerophilum sp. TaxID=2717341 RepID=UPI0038D40676
MGFQALLVDKLADGQVKAMVTTLEDGALPTEGNVTVRVEYSTVNYKDGLCITGGGGLVRSYPHVPGMDFAGT